MNFGAALQALKDGFRLERTGWNGKGLFVYYVPGGAFPALTEVAKKYIGETVTYNPYFAIKQADGTVSTWAASIGDQLADDWKIVE
jgi:hypothetical protein